MPEQTQKHRIHQLLALLIAGLLAQKVTHAGTQQALQQSCHVHSQHLELCGQTAVMHSNMQGQQTRPNSCPVETQDTFDSSLSHPHAVLCRRCQRGSVETV